MRGLAIGFFVFLGLIVAAWQSGNQAPIDDVAIASERVGLALESRRVDVGELTLHVVLAGPEDGPGVVLLHGFPEFWFSWHAQVAALARAGFRVAAPDLRGYNRSDKPDSIEAYESERYVADVIGLMDALGWETASIGGYDVGGGITWDVVLRHPERVSRAVVFQVSHPSTWAENSLEEDPETISWFRSFFRLPYLPELVARSANWWLLSRNLRETSRPGSFDDEELELYRAAWDRENAISTMLNSYRTNDAPTPLPPDGRLGVPVRLVFGELDAFLSSSAARASRQYLGDENVLLVPDATHWILIEEPELTSRVMIDFFASEASNADTG